MNNKMRNILLFGFFGGLLSGYTLVSFPYLGIGLLITIIVIAYVEYVKEIR